MMIMRMMTLIKSPVKHYKTD